MTVAWMLRQDGAAFPVTHHFYVMDDEDLSSEAEVAAFIIRSQSKDTDIARYVLDAWMSMLIEEMVSYDADEAEIDECILHALSLLPYRFQYPLSDQELLEIHKSAGNYNDVDSLYEFVDSVRDSLSSISDSIKKSLNQQFCRVRFGGQYNSHKGNNTIWFRISSVGFNWANTIYIFTSDNKAKYKIQSITICRDYESDNGDVEGKPEYIYKAKDGTPYYDMPIEEFLAEEHEHTMVFSSSQLNAGVLVTVQNELSRGHTLNEILCSLATSGISYDTRAWNYLVRKERKNCIECSEWLDNASIRTNSKFRRLLHNILQEYPELTDVDVEMEPYPNSKGNMVGHKYLFKLSSTTPELDGLVIDVAFPRNDVLIDTIMRHFKREYEDYIENRNIRIK